MFSIIHFHYDFLQSDIFLALNILAIFILDIYLHNLHYIAFYDMVSKNVCFPNKTIEQLNNRICI